MAKKILKLDELGLGGKLNGQIEKETAAEKPDANYQGGAEAKKLEFLSTLPGFYISDEIQKALREKDLEQLFRLVVGFFLAGIKSVVSAIPGLVDLKVRFEQDRAKGTTESARLVTEFSTHKLTAISNLSTRVSRLFIAEEQRKANADKKLKEAKLSEKKLDNDDPNNPGELNKLALSMTGSLRALGHISIAKIIIPFFLWFVVSLVIDVFAGYEGIKFGFSGKTAFGVLVATSLAMSFLAAVGGVCGAIWQKKVRVEKTIHREYPPNPATGENMKLWNIEGNEAEVKYFEETPLLIKAIFIICSSGLILGGGWMIWWRHGIANLDPTGSMQKTFVAAIVVVILAFTLLLWELFKYSGLLPDEIKKNNDLNQQLSEARETIEEHQELEPEADNFDARIDGLVNETVIDIQSKAAELNRQMKLYAGAATAIFTLYTWYEGLKAELFDKALSSVSKIVHVFADDEDVALSEGARAIGAQYNDEAKKRLRDWFFGELAKNQLDNLFNPAMIEEIKNMGLTEFTFSKHEVNVNTLRNLAQRTARAQN